jgi:polysaccharide biosynthesis protein PslJ
VRGMQGEDLATQMRFGEYRDALTLISRYPWFGVGFAGTPDIDTYLGVSNVYLLIAEEMGLVGLAGFLGTLAAFLWAFARAQARCIRGSRVEPLLLGTCVAVVGAMVGGMFDHYLFNLVFPHASALFWLMVGLGTVAIRITHLQIGNASAAQTSTRTLAPSDTHSLDSIGLGIPSPK